MGTLIAVFVGGLLAMGAAVLIHRKLRRPEGAAAASATDGPAPAAAGEGAAADEDEAEKLVERLVRLNIRVRTTWGMPPQSLGKIEEIVDRMIDTVPRMMERHPSETLTYELKRIAGAYLEEIVKEFADLSEKSRARHAETFLAVLGDIADQVRRAGEIVQHNEVAEFKVMASFLKTKYSSGGDP